MNSKSIKREKKSKNDTAIFVGSGNVFQDLGRADAAQAMAKVELAYRIHRLIEDAGWTQTQAAKRLGMDQPKVSNLMRGRLKDFSIERLFRMLNLLGRTSKCRLTTLDATKGNFGFSQRHRNESSQPAGTTLPGASGLFINPR
jgi:predicted XRE-type DNA-binding protein